MIIQISGKLRQGKGIFLVLLALIYCQMGYQVLANFEIKHRNAKKIDFYDFLNLLRQPRVKQKTFICIDELPTWIDSYSTTTSKSNRMASHFCNQSAKLGYDLAYTAQRTRRADVNYREMVDLSLRAEKDTVNQQFCYMVLDPNYIDEDIDTGRRIKISFQAAKLWWNKYNTYESVMPLGLEEFFFELEKTDPQRLLATVNRQADLLKSKGLRGRFTVAAVKLALMDCGELPFFAEYIAVRLQQ